MDDTTVAAALARLEQNQIHQEKQLTDLLQEVQAVQKDLEGVKLQASRWKGAFIVILALGGIAGWILERVTGYLQP